MRWKTKPTTKLGETRWVKKFAWFPVETDSGESLWLESYYVKLKYDREGDLDCTKEWRVLQTVTPEQYAAILEDIRWNIAITDNPKSHALPAFASLAVSFPRCKKDKECSIMTK